MPQHRGEKVHDEALLLVFPVHINTQCGKLYGGALSIIAELLIMTYLKRQQHERQQIANCISVITTPPQSLQYLYLSIGAHFVYINANKTNKYYETNIYHVPNQKMSRALALVIFRLGEFFVFLIFMYRTLQIKHGE